MKLRFLLILFAVYNVSCAKIWRDSPFPSIANQNNESTLAEAGTDTRSPFSLSLKEELHDGKKLFVQAELVSKTAWQAKKVELKLLGLKSGKIITEKSFNLAELLQEKVGTDSEYILEPSKVYDLMLSIPAQQIKNYQVELVWSGSQQNLSKSIEQDLEIIDLQISKRMDCSEKPCKIAFSVLGKLNNLSQTTINYAQLGVGFAFIPKGQTLDLSTVIPDNEEVMSLKGLNLEPGQARAFKVNIKSLVEERIDGEHAPVIRVLETN